MSGTTTAGPPPAPPQAEPRPRAGRTRRTLARLPRACLACAAIAFVNAALWAVLTPPMQVPDEWAHYEYSAYIGTHGSIPGATVPLKGVDSSEISAVVDAIPWTVEGKPTWYPHDVRGLHSRLRNLSRSPGSVPASAINNPPLYYALEAIPFEAGKSGYFFDRLLLMRLLSALMAAITVAFVFLFVREVLPRDPWAARVSALAVAFQPMFGFMSGGVNNDNLLYTCGAALIYLVARGLRRGLTPRLGLAIGAVAAVGMLTKTGFAGLLPGAALGVLLAIWRTAPQQRRRALGAAGIAALTLAVPFVAWLLASKGLFHRSTSTTTAGLNSSGITNAITLRGQLSYLWQVFLPPLPFMSRFGTLAGAYPLWDTYIQGFVGRFGWWRFSFPMWVDWVGLGVFSLIAALAAKALFQTRAALRRRWAEVITYAALAGGFVVLVEVASYRYQVQQHSAFEQTRYLFPLLAFYGLVVALAARGAGRRWGQAVGALLVVLAMGHSLFSMLLVVSHYYA